MFGPGHYFETEEQELAAVGRMVRDFTKLKEHLALHPGDEKSKTDFQKLQNSLKILTNGGLD